MTDRLHYLGIAPVTDGTVERANLRFAPEFGGVSPGGSVNRFSGVPEGLKNTGGDFDDADIVQFGKGERKLGSLQWGFGDADDDDGCGEDGCGDVDLSGVPEGLKNTGGDFDDADIVQFGDDDDDVGDGVGDGVGEYPWTCTGGFAGVPEGLKNTGGDFDDADIVQFGLANGSTLVIGGKAAKKPAKAPSKGKPTTDAQWLAAHTKRAHVLHPGDPKAEAMAFKHAAFKGFEKIAGRPFVSPSGAQGFVLLATRDAEIAVRKGAEILAKALDRNVRSRAYATTENFNGTPIYFVLGVGKNDDVGGGCGCRS